MIKRFEGESGKRMIVETLKSNKVIHGHEELAKAIAEHVQIEEVKKGAKLITQGEYTNDIYFILVGSFKLFVHDRPLYDRVANEVVGEMAAIEPTQKRSASVVANEDSIVAKLTEENFAKIGDDHQVIYRYIAKILAARLLQRNDFILGKNQKPRVFIISSSEGKAVAELIQASLEHENIQVIPWTQNVFRVSSYPMDALEREVDLADFAIAIATGDDIVESRGKEWPAVRDNVIFELGLFMGRLGRERAILMEPKGEGVKLPSDLAGITTIGYRYVPGENELSEIGPAIYKIKSHVKAWGLK